MMNTAHDGLSPHAVLQLFSTHRRLWLIPTVVGAVLGMLVAVLMTRYWEATQALIVRDEAHAGDGFDREPGKFASPSDMKSLQETILELGKSKSVVEATLREVGPGSRSASGTWPSDRVIDNFRQRISMTPPGGAEFGSTEVAYLNVRAEGKGRAIELVSSLSKQLDARFRSLRNKRAQSMIAELADAERLADKNLAEATEELGAFEAKVGADLTELRMLQTSPSATSVLRQRLVAAENDKRQHDTRKRQDEKLLTLLHDVRKDPHKLIATPNSLLSSQPALRRLKEGLVDAQLAKAQLLGIRSKNHPEVRAAQETEDQVRDHLYLELDAATKGLAVDLELSADRVAALEKQLNDGWARLGRLARLRTDYANLTALAENRMRHVERARRDLADARAAQASATAASLIQWIDGPEAGVNPVGVSRKTVAAAGLFGGLAFGIGLLFLFAEVPGGVPSGGVPSGGSTHGGSTPGGSLRKPSIAGVAAAAHGAAHSTAQTPAHTVAGASGNGSAQDGGASFGMFRGMTLQDAVRHVVDRDKPAE